MKAKTILEFDDYIITYKQNYIGFDSDAKLEIKSMMRNHRIKHYHLVTGHLFYDFRLFNGYMFLDNHFNLFDKVHKRYYGYNCFFIGDKDKIPFVLFDNDKDEYIDRKIKEGVEKMKKEQNETIKNKIEKDMTDELIKELNNYRLENVKLKNGKHIGHIYQVEVHDNRVECFRSNEKTYEGEFIQGNKGNDIAMFRHGKGKCFNDIGLYEKYPDTKSEFFYGERIGRGNIIDDKQEKFFFDGEFYEKEKKGDIIIYDTRDNFFEDYIILEINSKKENNPGRIVIKDIDREKIIYEITVKMFKVDNLNFLKPKGLGIVKDHRNNDILIVNFDSNNILSHNLQDLYIFLDKEELNMNKINNNDLDNINPNQEIQINYPKEYIKNIISNVTQNNNIEKLANKINEKIFEEKINYLGTQEQNCSKECWAYSLSKIICMTNARKYGRKLEDFNKIYNDLTSQFDKIVKTNEDMEKIINVMLPKYNLFYYKIFNENILKNYLKSGIKCLVSFDLTNKEWVNFSQYYKTYQIKPEEKLLTKEILLRSIYDINIEKPDELSRHFEILIDIDESNNYVFMNRWGENLGNKGIFKAKIDCLRNCVFYGIYHNIYCLTNEEKNYWEILKSNIKKATDEMNSIRCPICKRKAPIDKFYVKNNNKLICPFQEACVFDIRNNGDYEFEFIAEQIFYDKKNLFEFGFDLFK